MMKASCSSKLKAFINWTLYIILLVIGFIFAHGVFTEYWEGKTRFITKTIPLTSDDIPTLTICFEHQSNVFYAYGRDLLIGITYNKTSAKALQFGLNDFRGVDKLPAGLFLAELYVMHIKDWLRRKCYKISPPLGNNELMSNKTDFVKTNEFNINFFNGKHNIPEEVDLYLTTEANSYGAVADRWYDGRVDPYKLKKGSVHSITIPSVTAFENIPSRCSRKSYYQCLAALQGSNSKCKELQKPCSMLSLPTDEVFEDLPSCNESSVGCYTSTFQNNFANENICKGEGNKACVTQEYKVEDYISPYKIPYLEEVGTIFSYQFSLPKSTRGKRTGLPFKIVHKEELIHSGFGIVGTVGGSLGLMVGFSFSNITDWITDLIFQILDRCGSKKL